MSDSSTPQDDKAMSPASDGSRRDACRAAFERWADEDGCLRTIKKTNGSYLDSPTRWAWDGWRAATLTDEERDEIEGIVSDFQEIAEFNEERIHPHYAEKARRRAAMLIGLLERLG